jgi:hypothetical protein
MIAISVPALPVDSDVYHRLHAPLTIAYHEAGHAVVARSLSVEVTELTLECCRTRCRGDNPISCWSQAVTALAGPMAERRFADYPSGVTMRM